MSARLTEPSTQSEAQSETQGYSVSFTEPAGEPALLSPDSIAWQVFKNPISLYIGGITATLLELAEPRIRAGVWDNTSFKEQPLQRLKRTGLAAMVTVYGARSTAEKMIAGVTRMHGKVTGTTEDGTPYSALDEDLLNWVHITACYGFLECYHLYARPLSDNDKDRYYSEMVTPGHLYGARDVPTSVEDVDNFFAHMRPQLGQTEVTDEFLDILRKTPSLPAAIRPFQGLFIHAAIDLLPEKEKAILGYTDYKLNALQRWVVKLLALWADRRGNDALPAVQACKRLGLPRNHLYRKAN